MRDKGRLRFGVSVEGGALAHDEWCAVADAIGEKPDMVLWFEDFHAAPPTAGIAEVSDFDAIPIITWEPWHAPMGSIAFGEHDDHLIDWAEALGATGVDVYLRFAHEFNGNWYPWTPAKGAAPDRFVAAWRHAHDIFEQCGATNVQWVWCPNAVSVDAAALNAWYPADAYVNVLAIDGYNWGKVKSPGEWSSPEELFGPAMIQLREINSDKPVLIAEVACAESGGAKPEWISEFVAYVDTQTDADGFVWFEHDKETDWRITSSSAAADAMAEALRKRTAACEVTT
jgi:mannan endo-1,4-beta-mannosidase